MIDSLIAEAELAKEAFKLNYVTYTEIEKPLTDDINYGYMRLAADQLGRQMRFEVSEEAVGCAEYMSYGNVEFVAHVKLCNGCEKSDILNKIFQYFAQSDNFTPVYMTQNFSLVFQEQTEEEYVYIIPEDELMVTIGLVYEFPEISCGRTTDFCIV